MKFKKTAICSALILSLCGVTQASAYKIIVSQEKHNYDVVESQEPTPTDWEDVGSEYNCVARFDPADYNLGTSFTQIEDCDQKQERTVVIKEIFNGEERYRTITEERVIKVEVTYLETGTKNYKTGNQRTEHSPWVDNGSNYDCSTWLPEISNVYKDTSFTQNRDCSQDQDRTETIYDIWADGSETVASTTQQSQTITESEGQQAIGTMLAQSCLEILNGLGSTGDGIYEITNNNKSYNVSCNMTFDGGGWTMFGTDANYNLSNVDNGRYDIQILSSEDLTNIAYIKSISTENVLDSDWTVSVQADDSVNPSSFTYKSVDLTRQIKVEMMSGWNNTVMSLNFSNNYPRVYCTGADGTNNCGKLNKPQYKSYSENAFVTSILIDPRGTGSSAYQNQWHRNKSTVIGTKFFYLFR